MAQTQTQMNGSASYGENVVQGLKEEAKAEKESVKTLTKDERHVLDSFRVLIADLCEQFGGGHPGYVESLPD